MIEAFHAAHLRTFGYNYAGQQKVELVNFCVSGFGLIERPQLPKLAARADEPVSGRVSGARTIESPRWPLASLASATGRRASIARA